MSMLVGPEAYNLFYYGNCCGEDYVRTEIWLDRFRHYVGYIQNAINPKTVLDAGCAKGFLVEALREKGVDAHGIDLSEYAIENSHPSVRPYLTIQSLTTPISRRYDLVVTIEVLEHLPRIEAEKAIQNICSCTSDVIFSSSPFDYAEPTHINVHPPEYWATLFARFGFFRDVDFDASFLTPWAMRFRKGEPNIFEVIGRYERKLWEAQQSEFGARNHGAEVQSKASELVRQLHALTGEQNIDRALAAIQSKRQEFDDAKAALAETNQKLNRQATETDQFWKSKAGRLVKIVRTLKSFFV
jgi:SAM-dependent methyltransferase